MANTRVIGGLIVLGFVPILAAPPAALAFSIDSVLVLPEEQIWPTDLVTLRIDVITAQTPAFLFQPTEVGLVGDEVFVDIFVDNGIADAIDQLREDVPLARFQPGTYDYHVHLNPARPAGWGVRDVSGFFDVIPEPTTPCLLGLALVSLILRQCLVKCRLARSGHGARLPLGGSLHQADREL